LVVEQFAQGLEGEVLLFGLGDLGEELVGEDGDVGTGDAGGGEDVDDLGGDDRAVDELGDGGVALGAAAPAAAL
jgi:hypothetical protein